MVRLICVCIPRHAALGLVYTQYPGIGELDLFVDSFYILET